MRSFIIIAIVLMSACENKVEGPKGDQGIQGVAGEKGDKGEPGEKGDEGSKGDQGATGLQGEKGLQGIAGEKGETGSIGLAGVQGAKGDPGSIGLPGSDGTSCVGQSVTEGVLVTCGKETFLVKHGDVGPAGAKGDKGDAGSQGLKGDQGLQGIQGVAGKDGVPGLDGLPGAKGDVGSQGLQGIQGDKGDAGSKGSPGWDGIPGLKGDKGNQGEQGLQGIQGPQGVQGKPGELGKNLVAQCPEGSKAMVFKGHLKYCAHKFVFEKGLTWEQCLNTCLTNGLLIPPLHEFAIICLGDPTFFDQEKVNGCPDFPNCSTITGCPSDYSCSDKLWFHVAENQAGGDTTLRPTLAFEPYSPEMGKYFCEAVLEQSKGVVYAQPKSGQKRIFLNWYSYLRTVTVQDDFVPTVDATLLPRGCLCGKQI